MIVLQQCCLLLFRRPTYLWTALKVALVRSMRPPVGLNTSPRTPFPAPFTRPSSPSFLAPVGTDRGGYQLLAFVCDSPLIGCEITPVTPANTPCLEKTLTSFFYPPSLSLPVPLTEIPQNLAAPYRLFFYHSTLSIPGSSFQTLSLPFPFSLISLQPP